MIGVATSIVDPTSTIVYMKAKSATEIVTIFAASSTSVVSFMTLDAGTVEVYVSLQGASSSIMYARRFTDTTMYMIFIYQGKMAVMYRDSATDSNTKAKYLTNNVSTLSSSIYGSTTSMKRSDESYGWIGAISSDSRIYGFYVKNQNDNYPTVVRGFKIGPTSAQPIFLSAATVEEVRCHYLAYLTGNIGVVYYVESSPLFLVVRQLIINGLTNNRIVGSYQFSSLIFGVSAIGGESTSFSDSQVTLYKASIIASLVDTNTCYNQPSTTDISISSHAISEAAISSEDLTTLKGFVTITAAAKSAGTDSFISDTTKFVIRAQSTKDGSGNKCKLQPATTPAGYSYKEYAVSRTAAEDSLPTFTQCQGAMLKYTATLTGESTVPAWIENSETGSPKIKPAQVTAVADLKTHLVSIAISDTNSVPNTAISNWQITFTNAAPTVANAMAAQSMYQGMGAHTIAIPANTFADTDTVTITATNDLSGVTPKTFTLTGNNLNVEMPTSYKGTFKVTLTASDYLGQSVTNQFDLTVAECTQDHCERCTGLSKTDCTKCKSGYILAAGACNLPSPPQPAVSDTKTPSSNGNTYLSRTYNEVSPEGVGAPVFGVTALAIGVGFATGSAPVIAGLGVGQCQMVQVMSLFNMNVPDKYVDYSLSYEITKINIKFIGFIKLQDSLATGTRRNLGSGYTSLSNIGFHSGNFLVNYCYYFLLMIILVLVHLIVIGVVSMNWTKRNNKWMGRCMRATKRAFEFGVYFYFLIFASLFVFILTLNDIAATNFKTGLNGFSFVLSLFVLIFFVFLMIAPILFLIKNRLKKSTENDQERDTEEHEVHKEPRERTFLEKIWRNYTNGLRKNIFARLFYSCLLFKHLCYAIIFVLVSGKEAQLSLFISATFFYLLYIILVRPFEHLVQNII